MLDHRSPNKESIAAPAIVTAGNVWRNNAKPPYPQTIERKNIFVHPNWAGNYVKGDGTYRKVLSSIPLQLSIQINR